MSSTTTDLDNMEVQRQYNVNSCRESSESHREEEHSSSKLFESSRIKTLADERDAVQKKTFTKWVNSHLARVQCQITDLYVDLRDGCALTKLLEVLSGEQLPKPTRGRMRIHSLENVDKALQFLKEQRVHLENVGSHDIVDGNHRLTLGLIWTIILRFQIQVIKIETEDNRETRSAKDALLLWCQMKTTGYPGVNIQNFTSSWRDGLAFNALIHKHRQDVVDFNKLQKSNFTFNLQQAFSVAEQRLGIAKLLDPEGSVRVSLLRSLSKASTSFLPKRQVLDNALEAEQTIARYESLATELLEWIEQTIAAIGNQRFANSLAEFSGSSSFHHLLHCGETIQMSSGVCYSYPGKKVLAVHPIYASLHSLLTHRSSIFTPKRKPLALLTLPHLFSNPGNILINLLYTLSCHKSSPLSDEGGVRLLCPKVLGVSEIPERIAGPVAVAALGSGMAEMMVARLWPAAWPHQLLSSNGTDV
ncbi:spectrin beta chain, non-erythrocytic 1-like [Narcine bancroftii]|uniref:spectrin beta chain, non-erythrocytic 1-like n=1 Tax=Narcine bancroftii TaxID=1343680 RepID=UPI0038313C22